MPGALRVLVADDTPEVRALLRLTLDASRAFRVVAEARDGAEAIELAGTHRPDLVLLDLAMPVMDGLEAIPGIRLRSPDSRIVVLSGFNADRMGPIALQCGADAYLEKRYRPDELVRRLFAACRPAAVPEEEAAAGAETPAPPPAVGPQPVEDEVRRSRERFRLAFDHAPIGMAVTDLDGHFVMVNEALARMTGYEREQLLAMEVRDLRHPADADIDEAQHRDLLAGRIASYRVEKRYVRADGSTAWILLSRSVLRDDDDRPREYVLQAVDITDRKRSEDELQRFSAVLAHAVDGIARLDGGGRYVDVNPAFATMVGRPADELIGRHWAIDVHPDDRAAVADAEAAMTATGRATVEARGRRAGGGTFAMELLLVPIADATGAGAAAGGHHRFMRDVSERRRAADDLARSNTDLAHFGSVAAHELRAPLQAISGFTDLLARRYGATLDHQGRELVEWILRGTANMSDLIDDLLRYAQAGTVEVETGPVDLEAVVAAAAGDTEGGPRTVTWQHPLPVVVADPAQLTLVLHNLIGNAVKFVAAGVTPRVVVGARATDESWVVTVDDNGIGMPAADRERAFGMFSRLDARSRYEGTGIGLAICKRVVERAGGRIWVEDNPAGAGTRFSFTIPRIAPH